MNTDIQRSTFVTVIAWIFIIISGFGSFISILQNILIQAVFNSPGFEQATQSLPPQAPPFAAFMFSHFRLFFLIFLVFSLITFVSSVGLLKRKNWARLFFIALMLVGVIWNLASIVMQFFMYSYMRGQFPMTPDMPDMGGFMTVIMTFTIVMAVGFSIVFGWIARKLMSHDIITEFS